MKLEAAIKKADFNDLVKITSNLTPILTFWGTRYIKVVGYQDRAPIDSLAARVIKIVENKKFEYTDQERKKGALIAKNINKLYLDSDKQVDNSNILTRIFCVFYGFYHLINNCYVTRIIYPGSSESLIRSRWDDDNIGRDGFNKVFNYYTRNQYLAKFNLNPDIIGTEFWSKDVELAVGYDLIEAFSDRSRAEIKAKQEGSL